MERVGVLIEKLLDQLSQNADVHSMLITTQLLQSELLQQIKQNGEASTTAVSVVVPYVFGSTKLLPDEPMPSAPATPSIEVSPLLKEEKNIHEEVELMEEKLPIPGHQEPEPIPHFIPQDPWKSLFTAKHDSESSWAIDPMMEIPTLAHQEKIVYELNDSIGEAGQGGSVNDLLRENTKEIAAVLTEAPIKDLKKAISINDRHSFIRELFRDDEAMYERSIKTINSFHIFAEAEYWIQRELKIKLGWDVNLDLVKTFDQLVKRRFS